jgi:hypothetical protein
VKRISQFRSRRSSAKRKRKVAGRHGLAGHWQTQPKPMFTSGRVHYEIGGNTDAMSFGGIVAIHRRSHCRMCPVRAGGSVMCPAR